MRKEHLLFGRITSREALSRRRFIGRTVGVAGAGLMLGSGLGMPGLANVPGSGEPNPIPHITPGPFGPLHFFFPGPADSTDPFHGHDPSVITDFNGFVGQADLNLTGMGTDTKTGKTARYNFHTDMRFMKGEFVDTAGRNQHGAFAFI